MKPVLLHVGILATLAMLLLGQTEAPPASSPATTSTQPTAASTQPTSPTIAPGKFPMPSGAAVAIIPVEGDIYGFVLESLKRRVDRAVKGGASVIVLEMSTYGGTVISAIEISKYIKALPVHTVAWVHNKAYSAGIMIAAACDQIIMSTSSAIGDCAPIVPGAELAPAERAKALSPILTEFDDSANSNGYDFASFHAMCVLGVRVYYIEHKQTGQRRLVNQIDYELMVRGNNSTATPSATTHPDTESDAELEPIEVGIAVREVAGDEDLGQWQAVTVLPSGARLADGMVHAGNTFLTLHQTRALDIGLSRATLADRAAVGQYFGAASVTVVNQTWSENLSGYLTNPWVRGILMVALMLGAYMEFQAPGLGMPGAVAGLALITLLGAPFLVGLAEVWHIIVFFLGFLFLIIEIAFVPGFGMLGLAGLIMMFTGLVLMAVPSGGGPSFGPINLPPAEMWQRLLESITYMMAAMIVSLVGFVFITRHAGKIPGLSRLVLSEGTPLPAQIPLHVSGDDVIGQGNITVGAVGIAKTDLRPSGQGEFDGPLIDVVTCGDFIDNGKRIKVIETHGNRIVVEAIS
jgi:membrane-bound serine protease (ClpP class)